MDLPDSVAALGERLARDDAILDDPQLLNGADVFAAERARIFLRPWVAVDHRSRIGKPGRYVRCDAASRSILLTHDASGHLRALRNLCIHAGYPVCEAEEGPAERLVCPYHGWEYAADGRLLEPDLSSRIDPARLRLATHPVCIRDGLVFVDLSRPAPPSDAPETSGDPAETPIAAGLLPAWLAEGEVTERARYTTKWNWKLARQLMESLAQLSGDNAAPQEMAVFGPLSLMSIGPQHATLYCIIPKSAAQTDIQMVRIAAPGSLPLNGADRAAVALQEGGAPEAAVPPIELDRKFYGWYWSLMSPA